MARLSTSCERCGKSCRSVRSCHTEEDQFILVCDECKKILDDWHKAKKTRVVTK